MCLDVARAISSPKYRATTCSAISMPAEMPADVITRPSSTTCFPFAGRNDRVGMLCHQQDFKGGRLLTPFLFVQTDCRENLKGTAEIEDFDIFEKNDTDTFPLHLLPPSDETDAQAEPGGLMVSAGQPPAPACG